MKNTIRPTLIALLLFLAVGAFTLWPRHASAGHELIPFRKDLASAEAEAARLHEPILIDFMASWCGPCREMAATTWADPKVAKVLEKWVPVQIDVDQNSELVARFSIDAMPTLVLLDEKGTVITSSVGGMNSEQFLDWLHGSSKR